MTPDFKKEARDVYNQIFVHPPMRQQEADLLRTEIIERALSAAHAQGREEGLEEAAELAQTHCSYEKKNELFEKFPAGDQVTSMASYIARKIRSLKSPERDVKE